MEVRVDVARVGIPDTAAARIPDGKECGDLPVVRQREEPLARSRDVRNERAPTDSVLGQRQEEAGDSHPDRGVRVQVSGIPWRGLETLGSIGGHEDDGS